MVDKRPQTADHIMLHSVPPLTGGSGYIAARTGLKSSQIILEKFMPVTEDFTSDDGLPKPGTKATFSLKAQLPKEQEFMGGERALFDISSDDRLILVMLGSQPTVDAM